FAGNIDGSQVYGNLVCANDGSGVAMFKPTGSSRIYDNDIRFNGRRFRSPGISLMGSGHEVSDNYVAFQPGPGVGVVAYPKSEQNLVRNNFFRQLDGLSVDLGYNHNSAVSDYQFIDGPNPPRNSRQRRRDSANAAINAPEFDAYVFPMEGSGVMVTGRAARGAWGCGPLPGDRGAARPGQAVRVAAVCGSTSGTRIPVWITSGS
ncbi:MAG: cell envelope biogenesis protein OmpA, partial [Pseudomonadota bacterium]